MTGLQGIQSVRSSGMGGSDDDPLQFVTLDSQGNLKSSYTPTAAERKLGGGATISKAVGEMPAGMSFQVGGGAAPKISRPGAQKMPLHPFAMLGTSGSVRDLDNAKGLETIRLAAKTTKNRRFSLTTELREWSKAVDR